MFKSKHLIIDRAANRYKKVVKLLGLNVGEWKPLPSVNYLAITRVKFSKTVSSPKLMGNQSCTSNFSDYKYCLFLCVDSKRKQMVFKGEMQDVFNLAKDVEKYLEVETVDYTKAND